MSTAVALVDEAAALIAKGQLGAFEYDIREALQDMCPQATPADLGICARGLIELARLKVILQRRLHDLS